MKLPDTNLWLALSLSKHTHHAAAKAWLEETQADDEFKALLFAAATLGKATGCYVAVRVPGRNASAHGLSKVATREIANVSPELTVGWAVVEEEVPHPASTKDRAICIPRLVIGERSNLVT